MHVILRDLENLAYDIMGTLSRRKSEMYVYLTHEIDGFELYRVSEISVFTINNKAYRLVGKYSEPPSLDVLLKRIKEICKNNHVTITS